MTILEKTAQAISYATVHGRPEPGQLYQGLATAAITAFLAAAAEAGWHMRPDEVTEEMAIAGWPFLDLAAAAPKFELDK